MKKDEVALESRDGSEALRYSGKKRGYLFIYLFIYYITLRISFFFPTWYVTTMVSDYAFSILTIKKDLQHLKTL